ncbi:unnamed protein product [Clavelina lepadiformis]|uniref:GA-binding protein alpha chain n=1 Tax=Clavelina lepadiformis TaxID=159417 RepID=A0ABP0FYD3_CLALP
MSVNNHVSQTNLGQSKTVLKENSVTLLNPEACVIVQDIDTKTPLKVLREVIGKRLRKSDLSKHNIYLQQFLLDPDASLFDQGIKMNGKVELSIKVQSNDAPKLVIVEMSKVKEEKNQNSSMLEAKKVKRYLQQRTLMKKSIVKNEGHHDIPSNPELWTEAQVYKWMVWIAKEFGFDSSIIENYHVNGKTLCSMSRQDYTEKFPYGDLLCSHLELLKKLAEGTFESLSATDSVSGQTPVIIATTPSSSSAEQGVQASLPEDEVDESGLQKSFFVHDRSTPGNRTGNNGQIQLWQFLLEMLTDADCRDYIRWVGNCGEFKLLDPQMVAQKWGERKNKPAMNYEKLSRALRYYYDSEILCKVPGKRFVYRFICNLKELVGFDAAQLDKLVTDCAERRRKRTVDKYLHNPNQQDGANVLGNHD